MTRNELAPYNNCCILVSTIPVGKKKHDYFLHKDIVISVLQKSLKKDKGFISVTDIEYIQFKVDHLWISPKVVKDGNIIDDLTKHFDEVYEPNKLHFLAKVEKYTRNDNTEDYGLTDVTKVEKHIYQMLMLEYFYHSFDIAESLSEFYRYYKKYLTKSPLTLDEFFDKIINHALKITNIPDEQKVYYDKFLTDNINTTYFSTHFQVDMYIALLMSATFYAKIEDMCRRYNKYRNDNAGKIAKRINKRRFKQRIKSRAKGFAPNVRSN